MVNFVCSPPLHRIFLQSSKAERSAESGGEARPDSAPAELGRARLGRAVGPPRLAPKEEEEGAAWPDGGAAAASGGAGAALGAEPGGQRRRAGEEGAPGADRGGGGPLPLPTPRKGRPQDSASGPGGASRVVRTGSGGNPGRGSCFPTTFASHVSRGGGQPGVQSPAKQPELCRVRRQRRASRGGVGKATLPRILKSPFGPPPPLQGKGSGPEKASGVVWMPSRDPRTWGKPCRARPCRCFDRGGSRRSCQWVAELVAPLRTRNLPPEGSLGRGGTAPLPRDGLFRRGVGRS